MDVQRTHELAPAALVARIETASSGLVGLTGRDPAPGRPRARGAFSVMVCGGGGRRTLRWPDLVVETGQRWVALELELKTTERLTHRGRLPG